MTIEELQAEIEKLNQELTERTIELAKVTEAFNEHRAEAEKVVSQLYAEKEQLEARIKEYHEELESKEAYIQELETRIEDLKSETCIPSTAVAIIEGIRSLSDAEKMALAFIARTEKQGRDAFITMIYGKAPGSTSAEDHGHDHTHSFSEKVV